MVKCTKCKKKAEFCLPDKPQVCFCENHAIKYLQSTSESFLPRIKN